MADHKSVDNILQASVSVNKETYARLKKEDPDMCEALRELMKDDIDKATEEANKRADAATKRADEAERKLEAMTKERDSLLKIVHDQNK